MKRIRFKETVIVEYLQDLYKREHVVTTLKNNEALWFKFNKDVADWVEVNSEDSKELSQKYWDLGK